MSRNPAYDDELSSLKQRLEYTPCIGHFFPHTPADQVIQEGQALCDRMLATYESKDTDYSENDLPMGNLREATELGIDPYKGVLLRIGDKKRRIGSFVKRANYLVKDEGVDDTFVDAANYSLLGLALFQETYNRAGIYGQEMCDHFRDMAIFALLCNLLYQHRNTEDPDAWKGTCWRSFLDEYDAIADFARYDHCSSGT